MPSPKDGKPESLVAPAAPVDPEPPDEADPGQVAEVKAEQIQKKEGKYGAQKVQPYKPPTAEQQQAINEQRAAEAEQQQSAAPGSAAQQTQPAAAKPGTPPPRSQAAKEDAVQTNWIEVQLVGEDDKPVPGAHYKIVLPDGKTVDEGRLDHKGMVRLDGLPAGNCTLSFPDLDKDAWERIQ